jgi:hypothetical protein
MKVIIFFAVLLTILMWWSACYFFGLLGAVGCLCVGIAGALYIQFRGLP